MAELRVSGWQALALIALASCSGATNDGGVTGKNGTPGGGANVDGGGATSGDLGGSSGTGARGSGSGTGGASSGGDHGATGGASNIAGNTGKIPVGQAQCSDGIDNDGDGLIDSADPECTGPLDNDESSFATGIPGDNVDPKWQDCFFDGNSGGGDDGCRYATGCLTGELAPTSASCALSDQCRKFCMPLTPNGCDCFGCCEVPDAGGDGGVAHIFIKSTCTIADIGDQTKCPRCTPSPSCNNTCDHCELCLGKSTLPSDCAPMSGSGGAAGAGGASSTGGAKNSGGAGGGYCAAPTCAPGQQSCGVSCLPDCPAGDYCLTGCCVPSIR